MSYLVELARQIWAALFGQKPEADDFDSEFPE